MNKCIVSEDNINMQCDKHKQFLTKMDHTYRCMNTDELISKTKDHVYNIMLLWRELKLPITSSGHYQMKNIVGGLADKNEDHIERAHQDGKRSERIYCKLTHFQQSQIS